MLELSRSTAFKKDYKKAKKQVHDWTEFKKVVSMLQRQEKLPEKNHDHALRGDFKGFRDCHIEPDWVLIYRIDHGQLILVLSRIGSHSDLY
jgi:mRNA interferase YafQ